MIDLSLYQDSDIIEQRIKDMSKLKKGSKPHRNKNKGLTKGQKYIAQQSAPVDQIDSGDFKVLNQNK